MFHTEDENSVIKSVLQVTSVVVIAEQRHSLSVVTIAKKMHSALSQQEFVGHC